MIRNGSLDIDHNVMYSAGPTIILPVMVVVVVVSLQTLADGIKVLIVSIM
jgi:hypothetical protein